VNEDSQFIIKDALSADPKAIQLVQGIDFTEMKQVLKVIFADPSLRPADRIASMENIWRLIYRVKPPSIQDFLTPEWLGPTAGDLYPHVIQNLCEFGDCKSTKRHLILATSIGTGKSFTATIWALFVLVNLWCMIQPKRFYGLAQATSIVYALISFTMDKAQQLLLQPFLQIMISSPKFMRVKQEQYLVKKQTDFPEQIAWTTSGRMGVLQFFNDLHVILTSQPQGILGLSMIGATMSELSFFVDQGYSPEHIWRVYQDAKQRVGNRFVGYPYLTGTVMDSSPNDMELSPIDNYIFTGQCNEDPKNYVVTGPQWEFSAVGDRYKIWKKTGETFPVFRGSGKAPPRILTTADYNTVPEHEVFHVPIDIEIAFKENVTKAVKDFCGWPAGSQERLLRDEKTINSIFSSKLRNVYSYLYCDSRDSHERLLWNQVKDIFFVRHGVNEYEFWRSPNERRYLHIDLSESGDLTGIGMCHPEINRDGSLVVVVDFSLALSYRTDGRINLQAIPTFIEDLRAFGGLRIDGVSFDQYASPQMIQYLKDANFKAFKFSVDSSMAPYLLLFSLINTGRVRVGRNIFLKNNLKSLQEMTRAGSKTHKKVIDHLKGKTTLEDGGDWRNSQMGMNAKDVADGVCGAVARCLQDFSDHAQYIWEEDLPTSLSDEPISSVKSITSVVKGVSNDVRSKILEKVRFSSGYTLRK